MSNPRPKRGIHFLADSAFVALLERGARATGKSKTALVRQAVKEHVARIEAEILARRLEEAYRGLNDLNAKLDAEMGPADARWPQPRRR